MSHRPILSQVDYPSKKRTLYVLKCEQDKYYIGTTTRAIKSRIDEHLNKFGSEFTKRYKLLEIDNIIEGVDEFEEDRYVKIYMNEYGIDNVRGGSYSEINLPSYKVRALEDELSTVKNLCFRCNRKGHFIKDCYATTKVDGSSINTVHNIKPSKTTEDTSIICYRCNRKGHTSLNCYAKTKVDGSQLKDSHVKEEESLGCNIM